MLNYKKNSVHNFNKYNSFTQIRSGEKYGIATNSHKDDE